MENLNHLIEFFKTHWVEVLAAIGAIDVLLGIITKLTPFDWDDNIYTILHKAIAKLPAKK